MYLKTLHLQSFRNIQDTFIELEKPEQITIFLGQNANGKTNLLESIYLLSFPKSFRNHTLQDMISFQTNYFNIQATFSENPNQILETSLENNIVTTDLQFGYQINPSKKVYRHNKVDVSIEDFIVHLQAVIFTPEDIETIHGSPGQRRRLINATLAQFSAEYLEAYSKFQAILKQRNALLKRIKQKQASTQELTFWNEKFIDLSCTIHAYRQELFEFYQNIIADKYKYIADDDSQIEIKFKYDGNHLSDQFDSYKEIIEFQIIQSQSDEIRRGHTLFGPQKDDWQFYINSRPADKFASRGEKRSLILSLKILELEFLTHKTNQLPILLLDDVFSELDENRRLKLLELCQNYQTFISTVEYSYFQNSSQPIQVFKVESGSVISYNS